MKMIFLISKSPFKPSKTKVMSNKITTFVVGIIFSTTAFFSNAQCPVITCSLDTVSNNDPGMCDAIVNYSMPTAYDACSPTGSQVFTYTGAQQVFTVPAGVTTLTVDAYGAQGGSNSPSTNINYGGYVQADIAVTPGALIYVYVGEQPTGLTGGFNGGGNGETAGKGGGGASDIRIGGTTYAERVIVAGGAGGGGYWSGQEVHGGLGGGLVGGPGYRTDISNPGGDPGTQTSSGNGTCVSFNNPICAGGFGFGGSPTGCGCEGYGGGGGWYGGAGSGNCRGGGGGSSYTIPSATNVTHTQGVRIGHGEITLTWAGAAVPTITQIAGLASGSLFPVGTTTNTFVAQNLGGADTCSFNITVVDSENPSVSCPGDVEICAGEAVSGTTSTSLDNCPGITVTYVMSGATTGSGATNVDGVLFNSGTTTVWYTATDAAGNQDSCSFNVIVNPGPTVSLTAFSTDSLCDYNAPISLPQGTPAFGSYGGTGVSGSNFNPALANVGVNWVTYTYTDSTGCTNSDSSAIYVDGCATLDEGFLSTEIFVYPNPTNGLVNVTLNNFSGSFNYAITTIDGKIVQREKNHVGSSIILDLRNEQDGVYLLHIERDSVSRTLKLIKE